MRSNRFSWVLFSVSLGACLPRGGAPLRATTVSAVDILSPEAIATAGALRDRLSRGTRAMALVTSLVTEVGPRMAGTPGDKAAVAWALRTLPTLGLANVRAEPVTVPAWERGEARAQIVGPYPQPLVLAALGLSVPTPPGGVTAQVVEVEGLDALAKLPPAAVRGKIVFFNHIMRRAKDGGGYGVAGSIRARGPARAGKLGAAAVLIRSASTSHNRIPHTGNTSYNEDAPRIPAAALAVPDAELLARQLRLGRPVTVSMELTTRDAGLAESANIVAEVPGSVPGGELVLLGAHLDSWDVGPGALDDGAGVAIVLEAARHLAALPKKTRRTIRVVLYAAEESGIYGAKAYAKAHAAELARHAIATEADFGAAPVFSFRSRVPASALPVVDAIAGLLAPIGVARGHNDAEDGADLTPLRKAGVPVVSLLQDGSRYFDHHHTANDTLDKIDPRELDQAVAAFATFAYAAAETRASFGRIPVAETQKK